MDNRLTICIWPSGSIFTTLHQLHIIALGFAVMLGVLSPSGFARRFARDTLAQFLGSLLHTVVVGSTRLALGLVVVVLLAPFRLLGQLVRALRR